MIAAAASRSAAAVAALTLLACGATDDSAFTPQSFVEAMNEGGAGLALGPVLTTNPEGIDVNTVTFTELAPEAPTAEGQPPPTDVHGSATLVVFSDDATAEGEYERCQVAPILTCFRADNAVLRVEGLQPADDQRITEAISGLGSSPG